MPEVYATFAPAYLQGIIREGWLSVNKRCMPATDTSLWAQIRLILNQPRFQFHEGFVAVRDFVLEDDVNMVVLD